MINLGVILGLYRDNGKENGNYSLGFGGMIKKPCPFKGVYIRIPIIIPIKGRGFMN